MREVPPKKQLAEGPYFSSISDIFSSMVASASSQVMSFQPGFSPLGLVRIMGYFRRAG